MRERWWKHAFYAARAVHVLELLRRHRGPEELIDRAYLLYRGRRFGEPVPRDTLGFTSRYWRSPWQGVAGYIYDCDTGRNTRNRDMPQETEDETATGLIARMREYPTDTTLMAMLSDHWQEQGDPRWEPMQILSETPTTPDSACYLYTETGEAWGDAAIEAWAEAETPCPSLVDDRLMLCRVWKPGMGR